MKEGDDYCGFLCSDIFERQQEILDEIYEFSKVNPEFALVMLKKVTEMCYNSRLEIKPPAA